MIGERPPGRAGYRVPIDVAPIAQSADRCTRVGFRRVGSVEASGNGEALSWELEASYLAQALRSYTYVLATERILIGGGVMQAPQLPERVREQLGNQIAGCATSPIRDDDLDEYAVAPHPRLGQDAGLIRAIAPAMRAGRGWV